MEIKFYYFCFSVLIGILLVHRCRFSQMLHPIFEEASNVIKEEYPNENQVVFARVDCDQHSDIAQRYRISKYPTLKLFRNGMMMKREYRGQRSVKALADYIRQQKSDPIQELHDLAEITTLDRSKRNIIGYFEQKDSENYRVFERVAKILHDDCTFLSAFGAVSKPERYSGDNIVYKPPGHSAPDMVYLGYMTNFDGTFNWIQDKCVPLVREITFENGEELTEEGLPFLILFHMKEDTESLEIFQNEVARQLISEKGTINFLHADCDKFRHPLLHIQKTPADCPVIAIDSFRHMYVFGDFRDVFACAVSSVPENLSEAFCQYCYLTVICICKLCIWHLLASVALELVGSQNGCTMKLLAVTSQWELLKRRNSTCRTSGEDKKKKETESLENSSSSFLTYILENCTENSIMVLTQLIQPQDRKSKM
uniref:Endoplasmic reticulum protein 44 n=1 Tax=Sus scrofa TaxID=9823 RepID=A0A8D0N0L5_PIG